MGVSKPNPSPFIISAFSVTFVFQNSNSELLLPFWCVSSPPSPSLKRPSSTHCPHPSHLPWGRGIGGKKVETVHLNIYKGDVI